MKRQRLAGIEKEMARVISQALLEEVKNPKIKGIVSVTSVHVTEETEQVMSKSGMTYPIT
jgi:ribosome-binding factor A